MLRIILLLLVCISSLHAQTPESEYALLWEVTHPDQPQPSYLFGTMHVQDENVFKLPDSVLIGISQCDGFATEVAFDEAMNEVVSWALENQSTLEGKTKKRSFSERLESLLSEKAQTSDPMELFGNIGDDYTAGEEQETFLDAWLYRVARDENKVVGGLESIQDQMVLLLDEDNLFGGGSGRVGIDFLKAAYVKGDLKAIEAFMMSDEVSDGFRDEVLTKRNYTMARVGDSLLHIRPTFMAVGAAHLPGAEGVIALLEKRGYQLRRVLPTYTGVAETYRARPYKPHWESFEDKGMGIRVDVPAKPFGVPIQDLATMQFGMDLPGGFFYAFYRMKLPAAIPPSAQKETISQVVAGMGSEIKERSDVSQGGFQGEELFADADGFSFRVRILFDDASMLFTLVGISEKAVRSETANRFMNSIETFDPPSILEYDWKPYSFVENGFKAAFPTLPQYEYDPEVEEGKLSNRSYLFESKDDYHGHTVGIRASEQSMSGTYVPDSSWIAGMVEDFEWEGSEENSIRLVARNGVDGWEASGEYAGSETHIRQVNQGFKSFILYLTGEGDTLSAVADRFFESFALIPLPNPQFNQPYSQPGFQLNLPALPIEDLQSWSYFLFPGAVREDYYMGRDSLSTVGYQIENFTLSPYFRANDPDSLLWEYAELMGHDPEMSQWKSKEQEGRWLAEMVKLSGNGAMREHTRLYLDGQSVQSFSLMVPGDLDAPLAADHFFNSIVLEPESGYKILMEPKAKKMLDILATGNEVAQDEVLEHFYDYQMAPEEFQLFVDWFQLHPESDGRFRGAIAQLISRQDDQASSAWLEAHFKDLSDIPDQQLEIVQLLLDSPRPGSQVLGSQLFYKFLPDTEDSFPLTNILGQLEKIEPGLYDDRERLSPFLSKGIYAEGLGVEILGEIGGEYWDLNKSRRVLNLLASLLQEAAESGRMAEGVGYLRAVQAYFKSLSYVEPNKEDQEVAEKLLQSTSPEIQTIVARGMIAQGMEVDKKKLRSLVEIPGYGYNPLQILISEGKMKALPKKYYKPAFVAKQQLLHAYSPTSGVYRSISKLAYLEKRSLTYNGEPYTYYLYKVSLTGETEEYLGYSGMFSKDHKTGFPEMKRMGFSVEPYRPSNLESLVDNFESEVRSLRFDDDF